MGFSQTYKTLWGTVIVFVILPHINLGLLSDYKICGDPECESLMSRVQAIRDHHGKDCRFLSFRRGDTIFVYHKLTGQREDLWAGSIDKQFGHFPKDAVQEQQVHATMEKIVKTQESDFFCLDEFGYPIDSSHLDSDDEDDDGDDDETILNQESETTQTTPYTDDTNAESPSTTADVPTESPLSAREADGASTEEDESKNAGDAATVIHEEEREAPAAQSEQGGSAASPWLGSTVTGWLGLAKGEEPGNVAEGGQKETQAEASFSSSVTGWLGLGGEAKPDDAVKSEEDRDTAEYFASTMTGWLGYGGEKETDYPAEKEQDGERGNDDERDPAEIFRSRRMSLDLEGSRLQEEMGTLDWLGNRLSSTLGLGPTNQESGHETTERKAEETIQKEEQQPESSSWFDLGISGDILGFGKDVSDVDEGTGSGFKEEDATLEQPTGSEIVDTSQSQPALTEEVRTETSDESQVEEVPTERNAPSEMETVPGTTEPVSADSNNNHINVSDTSRDSVLPEDAASEVDQKDSSREDRSQGVGGMSSMINSFFQTGSEEDNGLDDNKEEKNIPYGERSAEMAGKDRKTPRSTENEGEDNDENFVTQPDMSLGPDFSSVDLNSNSMRQSAGEDEEDQTEDVVVERAEIPDRVDSTEGSTDTSLKLSVSADGREGEGKAAEVDVVHREASVDDTEAETRQGELGQAGEGHPVEGSSQEFGSSRSTYTTEGMSENASEEDGRTFSTSEGTTQVGNDADQLKGSVEETEKESENDLQPLQTEAAGLEEYILNKSGLKSALGSETETEEVEESKEEEKQEELKEVEDIKALEKEEEEKQDEVEEIKEEGKQKEMGKLQEEDQKDEMVKKKEEEKVNEVLKEEEKKGEIGELKQEEKGDERGEIKEIEKQDKMEGIKDNKEEEVEDLKEEAKQHKGKEIQEEGKQKEVEELKEEKTQEIKEEENKQEVGELKEEEKQGEKEESKEEEKQEELKEVEEIKALEKQQEMKEEKQDEVEELKEEEKQEVTAIKEEGKQKEMGELQEEDQKYEMVKKKEEEKVNGVLKEDEKKGEIGELKEEEKGDERGEINEIEKQDEMEDIKENKEEEVEDLKEEEKHKAKEIKEEGEQEEVEELKKEKTQEIKEEEKQDEVEELKEEEKQEVMEIKEEGKQKEVGELQEEDQKDESVKKKQEEKVDEELKEEEKGYEREEIKEIEKQDKMEDIKENKEEVVEDLKKEAKQHKEKEIKEEGKQEEVGELKEEEKQGEKEESKEEEKKDELEEKKERKKPEEMEELKKEGKQQKVEIKEVKKQDEEQKIKEEDNQQEVGELKEDQKREEEKELKEEEKLEEAEELKEEEKREELKEVEEVKNEGEEKQVQSSHSEVEMGNADRPESESHEKETRGENRAESESSGTSEDPRMEEERREEGNKKQEVVEEVKDGLKQKEAEEKVEGERRVKEEEGSLKCSDASEDGLAGDRDGEDTANRLSSTDEELGKKNPGADGAGGSQAAASGGKESDEEQIQEEEEKGDKRGHGAEADEGKEQQNEDVNSRNTNGLSDLNALGVNQTGQIEHTDTDLLYSGERGQSSLPNHISLSQTAEDKEGDQLYSVTELSDDSVLPQGGKAEPEDTDTSSYGISTDREERETNAWHEDADMQINNNDPDTVGTESRAQGVLVSSSEAVISGQTVPTSSLLPAGHTEGTAEAESGGALGLFKNAFSFFSQTPATDSSPSLDSNTGETSETQASLTPEQELDPPTDSHQVHVRDMHTVTPVTPSQQQPPSPPYIQASPPSPTQTHMTSLSPNTGSPLQTKTLSKHYKNLLAHMGADEAALLEELFGRHKLQFLDYVLGSAETATDDPDNDESILLDVERLLRYHVETLVAPSTRLGDAPQEDKEKTRTLIALQKLEMLLAKVREAFSTGKSHITNINHQAEESCAGESCSTHSKDKKMATNRESSVMGDSSVGPDDNAPRDEWMWADTETGGQLMSGGGTGKERATESEEGGEKGKSSEDERVSPESRPHTQPGSPPQPLEGVRKQILDIVHQVAEDSTTHVHATRDLLIWLTVQVVSSLPDDIRPGPDLYGVPWEPVIISSLVGLMTVLLFTCRCYSSVKSRMYRSKERWMAEQVAELLDEKCKVLETLSQCQQEYDELESSLRDSGVLAQTQKTEQLEVKARQLGHAKQELEMDLEQLKDQLDQQREHRMEQERRIEVLEENMKTFEEESKDLQSQEEQAQTTLKVYNMNSDRLQRNLETAGEENALLQESNAQLRQQVEGWAERVSELEAEMSRCEVAYSGMLQDVTNKDERIKSLTDRLLGMKAWDSDLEEEEGDEGGEKETSNGTARKGEENGRGDKVDTQGHLQKVQKLLYAAKLNADLKSVDEDKDRAFAKLNDEVKAKEDLQVRIKELENEKLSLQSDSEHYSDQVQRLQQKLHIMTEMYQENELKLHRLLTVEEKERMQKEEKLNKADKNIALAMEELNNYRQRAEEMEEELEKTKQSYQTQMSAHEKKAHNNWLAARAADRELADIRRENALFRQKLTDTQFKLDALDKDPYALDTLARPLPFRAERSPYGPSPLGRPASETRAFLSPPTLMDGPPARLSPRVLRGPGEPPGGQAEMERSGGPHSDSGSISPTWERDRRGPPPGPPGPLGPPGYMFAEPGGPMYRRPPPPPGAMGLMPPPGSLPPVPIPPRGLPPGPPHPADMADGTYRENSHGPGEQDHRESGPGDRRTPPEADPRMGGAPPPGPPMGPMGPMDGPFPRRAPYGPPPPDFFPPRGPGGPPMMQRWGPPPPGMMFPRHFPPSGPPLPPAPHPHHAPFMRPPFPDGLPPPSMGPPPPRQPLPSQPHSQSPEQHTPSPEDAI